MDVLTASVMTAAQAMQEGSAKLLQDVTSAKTVATIQAAIRAAAEAANGGQAVGRVQSLRRRHTGERRCHG